ncbi:MAG: hypothetical protein GY697_23930 [Desulfobacterales bacterium]|nr:hypothetical protein [Desulfobacterales bacterium]
MYLTMLFKPDFWKLLVVCLKMLFRKSTRKRFLCLVAAFLFTLGFNTHNYINKFQEAEISKAKVLEEKAFKAFFMRFRTKTDYLKFQKQQAPDLGGQGARPLKTAFIYQNNLFIPFRSNLPANLDRVNPDTEGLALLYDLFGLEAGVADFLLDKNPSAYTFRARNRYFDHNGSNLDLDIILARHTALKGDLTDAATLLRGNLTGKRLSAFNDLAWRITNNISRVTPLESWVANPFFSRVALIVPLNFFHIFTNMANDITTDILDYAESVRAVKNAIIEVEKVYLQVPERYANSLLYGDIDLYPRYIPLYVPQLLTVRWHWLLYEDIAINTAFMEKLDRLHYKGNYLFSYEKTLSIKERVKKINADIFANHIDFYMTDLSMGIVFPFMISLFAFIHLKTELAFLLMFKNRVRELLVVFWMLPLGLMLFVKCGLVGVYLVHQFSGSLSSTATGTMMVPMAVSFILAAVIFFPINRWCFSQFTGEQLSLSILHKGR